MSYLWAEISVYVWWSAMIYGISRVLYLSACLLYTQREVGFFSFPMLGHLVFFIFLLDFFRREARRWLRRTHRELRSRKEEK